GAGGGGGGGGVGARRGAGRGARGGRRRGAGGGRGEGGERGGWSGGRRGGGGGGGGGSGGHRPRGDGATRARRGIHRKHVAAHRTACTHAPGRDLGWVHAIHRLARRTGDVHLAPAPLVLIELRVVAAVDHEHRSRLRFRVAFHLRRELTHLRRVREPAVLVGHDPDRQRHERHAVQLAASILAEVV